MKKRDIGLVLMGVGAGVISNAFPKGPHILTWPPALDWYSVIVGAGLIVIGYKLLGK